MADGRSKVLLVDDDPLILASLTAAAEDSGFAALAAADDGEALAVLDTVADLAGLITDIDLGSANDGWRLAERARALRPNLPVIYASGSEFSDLGECGVAGSVMIRKPFAPLHLMAVLREMIRRAPAG